MPSEENTRPSPGGFLSKTGNYRQLLSYRKSEIIYDFTFRFCQKFLHRGDPRAVLEKFSALEMIDVHLPCTDGRKVILSRYTQPEEDLHFLLHQLGLQLPAQPFPRITQSGVVNPV